MLQVVQAFVRQAMGFLDKAPSQEDKVELIKTLQSITEGKVSPCPQDGVQLAGDTSFEPGSVSVLTPG